MSEAKQAYDENTYQYDLLLARALKLTKAQRLGLW